MASVREAFDLWFLLSIPLMLAAGLGAIFGSVGILVWISHQPSAETRFTAY